MSVRRSTCVPTFVGVLLALGAASCSDLDPASDDCDSLDLAGCNPVGGGLNDAELPPEWRCLAADYVPEAPPQSASMQVTYTGSVLDFQFAQPMTATVTPCLINDVTCMPPLFGQAAPVPPSANDPLPRIAATVPRTFEGYMRLTAEGYIPQDWYLQGPLLNNVQNPLPFLMVSQQAFVDFSRGLGLDPLEVAPLGVLAVYVLDCDGNRAPDVTVRLPDAETDPALDDVVPWGIQRRIPVANRPTDVDGIAGFAKLPVKNISVEAVVNGRNFGLTSFRIEGGRLTTGAIRSVYSSGQ
jgi:hypothetical protein